MTTTPAANVGVLPDGGVADMLAKLESDFGRRGLHDGALVNQVLLDALDRGEQPRFLVWPAGDPIAALYVSASGTLVPAGDPTAGAALAESAERTGWRVLVGDGPVGEALLDAYPRALFRRRPHARRQRLLVVSRTIGFEIAGAPPPEGYRRATMADLDTLTDMACRLHVEDQMGPAIPRSNRPGVRSRMADSVRRGLTYVVDRDGGVVGKLDLSLHSRSRGAQIAGVYVYAAYRGQGIAGGAVRALSAALLAEGSPGVSLHVRADNDSAIAAYARAGMTERATWVLALR